jgi:hypothetical protein
VLWLQTPPSGDEIDPNIVIPGVWGFLVTFALIVVVVLLITDMVRRTRRVTYRAAVNAKLDAEEAAARDAEE